MDVDAPLALLGGLSPQRFMRRHWQKKPLLVRGAVEVGAPLLSRQTLFALAGRDDVESRLVVRRGGRWAVRQGPLPRRALPPISQPDWTLLVQGVNLQLPAAHQLLQAFRFVPAARLDDVMVSWASHAGGVGPHVDSYDVFLLQLQGRRRWKVGRVKDAALVDGAPLKILRSFVPEHDWLLEPGDMLYVPPRWGHDGIADGGCMTASIGFRAPADDDLARDVLQRLAEQEPLAGRLYRDPRQSATAQPGAVPPALLAFAAQAVQRLLAEPGAVAKAVGEAFSEPKAQVWFTSNRAPWLPEHGLVLDTKTRMLYDADHVFINGEAFEAGGRDARLLQALADSGFLSARGCSALSAGARVLLSGWVASGWLHGEDR